VEFVGLADMEIPFKGFRRPPTEALDVVFKDAVVSSMLCCWAVARVAFVVLLALVLEALPHLVDVLVSQRVPLCVRNRGARGGWGSRIKRARSADTGHAACDLTRSCDYDFDTCVVIV
jgi:hypothetical protein